MKRHIGFQILVAVLVAHEAQAQSRVPARDIVYEASITDLQRELASGRLTSAQLVDAYLARIAAYDRQGPKLNALIDLNPRAHADAVALDAERRAGKVRGPLHGIPVILKDNYGTADMPTSAGSIALATLHTGRDAFVVKKLREAGAIILGKSNLHELAAGILTISSLGGQTCNPYDPSRYPGGSSGGTAAAVAASMGAIGWGSDTCGSIRIPSAFNSLFGLRPTKGLTSVDGIVPLSHSQDVSGPLARTVMDLAIGLDATVGPDAADSATRILAGKPLPRFVASLDTASLRGARFGVVTGLFGSAPDDQEVARIVRAAIDRLKQRGAEVVEVDLGTIDSMAAHAGVIPFELKPDLADYLAKVPHPPVTSLKEILDSGWYDRNLEQTLRQRERAGTRDSEAYRHALALRDSTRDAVVRLLDDGHLDALVYPTITRKPEHFGEPQRGANCQLSAVTGLPALSMPAGFTADSLPVGVELLGRSLSDARLVSFAYDYEQSTHPRRPPDTTPSLENGRAPAPRLFDVTAKGKGIAAHATLRYDATRRALSYDVRVSGADSARVTAITLDESRASGPGPVLERLAGAQTARAKGEIVLTPTERYDLLNGRVTVAVYTTERASAAARAKVSATTSGKERLR